MSHTASVMVEFTRKDVLKETCERLNMQMIEGTQRIKFYQAKDEEVELSIQLPDWRYPVGIRGQEAVFDNYNGRWGNMKEFTRLQNEYSRDLMNVIAGEEGMMVDEDEYDNVTGESVMYLSTYD